ncbi:MAG: OmpA family protein [Acetobacteraceae bacterium]
MRCKLAILVMVPAVLVAGAAWAQNNPSVEQIIRSLTPTGDVSGAATRGIRLGPTPPVAASTSNRTVMPAASRSIQAAPPAGPAAADTAAAAPSVNLTVNFALGSADLTPQAIEVLDRLGAALSNETLATYRFRVEGHTDTVGTHEYNRQLSRRRAIAVVEYISTKYGVAGSRLEAIGMGSDRLLVPTEDQVSEMRNRRVQVVNIGS